MNKIKINISGNEELSSTLGAIIHDALANYNINNVLTVPVDVNTAVDTTRNIMVKKCFKKDFENSDVNITISS